MKIGRLASIAAMVCLVGYLLAGPGFRMLLRSEFEQSLPLSLTSIQSASVSLQGMIEAKNSSFKGLIGKTMVEKPLGRAGRYRPRSSSALAAGIAAKTTLRRSSRFPWHSPRRSERVGDLHDVASESQTSPRSRLFPQWTSRPISGEVWNEFQRSAPIAIDVRNTKDRWNAAIVPLQISLDETEKRVRACDPFPSMPRTRSGIAKYLNRRWKKPRNSLCKCNVFKCKCSRPRRSSKVTSRSRCNGFNRKPTHCQQTRDQQP